MDAHVGIVAEPLDERAEGLVADGDVLVVVVVRTAKNEVYRLEFELFLKFKHEVERVERVFAFAAQHRMSLAQILAVAGSQILEETT